jgi:hypothetical protein
LHLSSLTVRAGQTLAEGGAVGAVGTTGRRSTQAPHLHFGVREAGQRNAYRDPLDFLAPPAAAQRPGPVPVPVPVGTGQPAAADPAPAPGSAAPSPAPVPALGSPYLVPSQARAAPHPHAAHGLVPRPLAPTAAPHSAGRTDRHMAPAHGGTTARARHMAPPGIGPHSATETAESAAPHYAPATPGATHSHGINLGWLAACIGLIALATALGHPDGTRQAAARSRAAAGRRRAALARAGTRLGALLRPASRGGPAR